MNVPVRTASGSDNSIQHYSEFWDFYVEEHSKPMTRLLHFIGTSLGICESPPRGKRFQ